MKRQQLSLIAGTAVCMLIVLLTIVYALPSSQADLTPCDLGALPEEAVKTVLKKDLMDTEQKDEKVYFHPEKPVTRAEFAKTISLLLELPSHQYQEQSLGFTDEASIPSEYLPYVRVMLSDSTMKLYADLTFRPNTDITREEAADIIGSLLKGEVASGKSEAYSDFETVSSHFSYYAEKAVDHGIMTGFSDGTFQPKKELTRGEFVLILHNILQNEHLLQRK